WPVADFHMSRAIELQPQTPFAYANRGQVRLYLGRWEAAAADYAIQVKRGENCEMRYLHAGALLQAGKLEDYRAACAEALAVAAKGRSGETDRDAVYAAARMSLLASTGIDDADNLCRLTMQEFARQKLAPAESHMLALASYRAGKLDEAIKF